MPHVIIEGPASIDEFYQAFEPIHIREQDVVMKVRDVFLNTRKTRALIECIVVEDGVPLNFYMIVSQKDTSITVRLDPLTDPERTDGVKRLLALVGHKLKSQNPECRYGTHNLSGYLIED